MAKKKVKKFNTKKFICFMVVLIFIMYMVIKYITANIQNIYIIGAANITDNEVLTISNLKTYPSFVLTSKSNIKKKILKNKLIKSVEIKKTINMKLYIEIEEYKIIAITTDNKLILENGEKIENTYNIKSYPRLINDVDENEYNTFIKKFSLVDDKVIKNISEIEYVPNDVDNQRFLLYMNDKNNVYITLTKIKKLNKYNQICEQLENKIGTIYLDSGDYVELKS